MATNQWDWTRAQPRDTNYGRFGVGVVGGAGAGAGASSPQIPQFNYTPPSGPDPAVGNAFAPLSGYGNYKSQENRMGLSSYSDNYLQPYLNYQLQAGDQAYNQQYGAWNANQTAAMNQYNMGLQDRQQSLQEQAYNASLQQFGATNDYNYADLNARTGLGYAGLTSQETIAGGQQAVDRYGIDTTAKTAAGQQSVDRYGIDTTAKTAAGQQSVDRYGIDTTAKTAAGQQSVDRYGIDTTAKTAAGQQSVDRYGIDTTAGTARYGVDTSARTAANQLQFQYKGQTLDESYRRAAMAQDAALTREKYNNDLTQSRYSAFGRSQAPSFRAVNSWR